MAGLIPDAVKDAVEIAKAAIPMQSGSWIPDPNSVATFIETVAKKIHDLRTGAAPQR
jgi:hypothetical protein